MMGLAAISFCQEPTTNADIIFAMQQFAGSATLKMTLDGTETMDRRGKAFHVETSLLVTSTASGTVLGLIEIVEFQNGLLTQRTVGDGQTLWIYNAKSAEYMAMPYGIVGGDPTAYFAKLSDGIGAYVEGFGTYPVRFLRDILYRRDSFGSSGATFRSWVPGFTPLRLAEINQPYPDPINPTRVYRADETRYFIHNANGSRPSKSVTFEFEIGTSSNQLTSCYFSELTAVGIRKRLVDWQMGFINSGLSFPPETFQFVPPKQAAAVPLPKIG